MAKKQKSSKRFDISQIDKSEIEYNRIIVSCVCGAEFESGSTLKELRVDICSNCHPFFTGDQRLLDTEGRIDKFRKKYNLDA
eukprot:COSAG01_NODE_4_length_55812_cov_1344.168109_41_plen_82_part_00